MHKYMERIHTERHGYKTMNFINWWAKCRFSFSQDCSLLSGVSRTGSASDWCALQEALYKCI